MLLRPLQNSGTKQGTAGLPLPFAGVDETGRGCLAGPVVAAAVVLPQTFDLPFLDDSKKLTPLQRLKLEKAVKAQAESWAVGISWPREIDRLDILQASLLAMCRAVQRLKISPRSVIVDGNQKMPMALPQRCIVGGDGLIPAISAASIIAKTYRDRLMDVLHNRYPGYALSEHKGYGTRVHLRALATLGPSPIHRRSFKGVLPLREKRVWLPGI